MKRGHNRRGIAIAVDYAALLVISILMAALVSFIIFNYVSSPTEKYTVTAVTVYSRTLETNKISYTIMLEMYCKDPADIYVVGVTLITQAGDLQPIKMNPTAAPGVSTGSGAGYIATAEIDPVTCDNDYKGAVTVIVDGPGVEGAELGELVLLFDGPTGSYYMPIIPPGTIPVD